MPDTISLHNLTLSAIIGADWWGRLRPQPVLLSLHVYTNLERVGSSDDLAHTMDYGNLANALLELQASKRTFSDLAELAEAAAAAVSLRPPSLSLQRVRVVAEAPKLVLCGQGLGVDIVRPRENPDSCDKVYIKDLAVAVIIGVNPPERQRKQLVVTNVTFHCAAKGFPFALKVAERLTEHIEGTTYLTLERFVTSVAQVACGMEGIDAVSVRAKKPSAVSFGESSEVEITRNRAYFEGNAESSDEDARPGSGADPESGHSATPTPPPASSTPASAICGPGSMGPPPLPRTEIEFESISPTASARAFQKRPSSSATRKRTVSSMSVDASASEGSAWKKRRGGGAAALQDISTDLSVLVGSLKETSRQKEEALRQKDETIRQMDETIQQTQEALHMQVEKVHLQADRVKLERDKMARTEEALLERALMRVQELPYLTPQECAMLFQELAMHPAKVQVICFTSGEPLKEYMRLLVQELVGHMSVHDGPL